MIGLTDGTVSAAVSAISVVQVGLGLIITVIAVVGYRHNRSSPMLSLAIGIGFLTFIQFLLSIGLSQLDAIRIVGLANQLSELVGLVFILYSIILAHRIEA